MAKITCKNEIGDNFLNLINLIKLINSNVFSMKNKDFLHRLEAYVCVYYGSVEIMKYEIKTQVITDFL